MILLNTASSYRRIAPQFLSAPIPQTDRYVCNATSNTRPPKPARLLATKRSAAQKFTTFFMNEKTSGGLFIKRRYPIEQTTRKDLDRWANMFV